MKIFVFLALVAFARAELYAECESDNDCDEKTETCHKKPTFEAPGEFEEKGHCFHKQKEYDICVIDSNCEEDHFCVRHALMETPAPMFGRCTQCRQDDDCGSNDYCKYPVLNGHCAKTFLIKQKLEAAKEKHEEMLQKFLERKFSEDDEEDEEGPPGFPQQDDDRQGGRRNGRFPNFPTFDNRNDRPSSRNKRSLGDPWTINIPNLRCTPKHPANAPCYRSGECESGTCTIEGFCQ